MKSSPKAFTVTLVAVSVVIVLLGIVLIVNNQRSPIGTFGSREYEPRTITRVIDGDSLEVVDVDGKKSLVKILGIDAPEVGNSNQESECGADDATAFLVDALPPGTKVRLIEDQSFTRSEYKNHILRYVETADGVDVGRMVLEAGYADAWLPSEAEVAERFADYRQASVIALDNNEGAWANCDLTESPE